MMDSDACQLPGSYAFSSSVPACPARRQTRCPTRPVMVSRDEFADTLMDNCPRTVSCPQRSSYLSTVDVSRPMPTKRHAHVVVHDGEDDYGWMHPGAGLFALGLLIGIIALIMYLANVARNITFWVMIVGFILALIGIIWWIAMKWSDAL